MNFMIDYNVTIKQDIGEKIIKFLFIHKSEMMNLDKPRW